jgi:hypothetical protein
MEDDDGDRMVKVLEIMRDELAELRKKVAFIERYLRDEGYGDEDPPGPEDLDDD